jgi:hypothetical protein
MTIEYPDIVSEYVDALERYEVNGVQVVPCLEPPDIPAGGYAMLILLLASQSR